MAKKKRLVESLDEEELAYISSKMIPEKGEPSTNSSKLLNFKLKLKCKNQKQKNIKRKKIHKLNFAKIKPLVHQRIQYQESEKRTHKKEENVYKSYIR